MSRPDPLYAMVASTIGRSSLEMPCAPQERVDLAPREMVPVDDRPDTALEPDAGDVPIRQQHSGRRGAASARSGQPAGEPRRRRSAPVALLFDRDDTLIVDVPYCSDPALVRPVAGAREALRELRAIGVPLGVVSNQSGVARGLITPEQLGQVNAKVEQLLGPFDTWQVCLHGADDGCECRKPKPGMVLRAAAELGVDVRRCVLIGDIGADVAAAESAGARPILVPTDRTRPEEVEHARRNATVAGNLTEAIESAMGGTR